MTLQETKQYIAIFYDVFSYISIKILFQAEQNIKIPTDFNCRDCPYKYTLPFLFPQSSILNLGNPWIYFYIIFSVEYADAVPLLTKLDLFSTHDSVFLLTEW